jgi:hypothetical protein
MDMFGLANEIVKEFAGVGIASVTVHAVHMIVQAKKTAAAKHKRKVAARKAAATRKARKAVK